MTEFGGILLYLGLLIVVAGVLSLVKPLRFLGIPSRRRGLLVLGCGFLAFVAGVSLPVTETRVETPRTQLDEFEPAYQFNEFHSVVIDASRERVDAAIRAVRPHEILFFRTLTWIRRFGRPGGPSVLNPAAGRPILDAFTSGGFVLLADEPGREIVFGSAGDARGNKRATAAEFKTAQTEPLVKIAMNFHIEELDAAHCRVTTETRVFAAGTHVVRGFATYWRMIYPGSALIRRMWLRAIKLRAEGSQSGS